MKGETDDHVGIASPPGTGSDARGEPGWQGLLRALLTHVDRHRHSLFCSLLHLPWHHPGRPREPSASQWRRLRSTTVTRPPRDDRFAVDSLLEATSRARTSAARGAYIGMTACFCQRSCADGDPRLMRLMRSLRCARCL
jgi:hypothetical protein